MLCLYPGSWWSRWFAVVLQKDTVHYVAYTPPIYNVDVEFEKTGFRYYFSTE